jgi:FkbM family methyltransferase
MNDLTKANSPFLSGLASFAKAMPLPHAAKYLIFKTIEGRQLRLPSKLAFSNVDVHLDVGDFVQFWMYVDSIYERPWVEFIQTRIKNKVFFDVGANVGNFAFSLCHLAKQVYAFEASSHCCHQIRSTIQQTNLTNIELVQAAIHSSSGQTIELFLDENSFGNSSLFQINGVHKASEKVPTISIDEFCHKKQITDIGLMKIDIEGAERFAIQGAKHTLEKLKPDLVMEFNQMVAKNQAQDVGLLWDDLMRLGYKGYRLNGGTLTPFALPANYEKINHNLFFSQQ